MTARETEIGKAYVCLKRVGMRRWTFAALAAATPADLAALAEELDVRATLATQAWRHRYLTLGARAVRRIAR